MPIPWIDRTAAEAQTLVEILDWYRGIVEALLEHRASVQRAIQESSVVSSRFLGMTEAEIDAQYDAAHRELDRLTVLNLVSSAEETLMVDFFRRVEKKQKDPLSAAYRKWHKSLSPKKQIRPSLDGKGVVEVLKQADVVDAHLIGRYRECLQTRHWLGHGRSWSRQAADRFDPEEVHQRAEALLQAMPI